MMRTILWLPMLLLSGCSLFPFGQQDANTGAGVVDRASSARLKILPNEPFDVTHQDVIRHYENYLAIATDAEMRVRVSHRIAALKLQAEDMAAASGQGNERALALASIQDYEQLLQQYPDRRDNDALLYQLAKAYVLVGRSQSAIGALEQLVQDFPRSDYYLEAEFRLGQLLYASHDYEMAAQAYQRLVNAGRNNNLYYVSAGYFLGWSLFKQQKNEESLLAFSRVLDEEYPTEAALENAKGGELDMRNDIVRIMAIIFSDTGSEQIASFSKKHGARHYEYMLYSQLANLNYDKQYYRSGASALRAFVQRYPMDKRAPEYYQRIVDNFQQARYPDLMRRHKESYVQLFGVGSDYWQQADSVQQAKLSKTLAQYIWDMANFYHGYAQATKNPNDKKQRFEQAQVWYGEYLRSFPNAQDAAKAHFLIAEVAFELRDFINARHHYEIVAYQYPAYEKASEAGYAAILAYNQHKPAVKEARQWRQATVASAMRFVQEFPSDPRSGTVLVNTAEMLLADKYFAQALKTARLAEQIEHALPVRYQYGAALVRGHASFELGQFAEAEHALLAALKMQQSDTKTQKELQDKVAASIYRQGEMAQEQDDLALAVSHWRRLGNIIPNSNTRILAEYDAATLLMQMENYPEAIEVLLQFRNRYPQHKLNADIPSKLIVAYESQQNWQGAAQELYRIYSEGKDKEQQRIALYQAAEYYEKADDTDNALNMYREYAHNYKRPFDVAVEAHHRLDQIYAKLNDEEKRRFWLDKIITLHNRAGAEQGDRSRYLAASAAFQLGEFERSYYEKLRITLPLDRSVTRKNNALQAAQKRYTQAVQLGVLEFTTASTFHLGQLYAQMSKALMTSERPKGLDELELEEYNFILEEQAFPLDEAAIEIHQANTNRSRDGLYDAWIRRSYSTLAEIMPGQYNKTEKALTYVDQIR